MARLKVTWRDGLAYATGSIGGKRVRKSLGTRDARQADELCTRYEAKLWKRHSYGEEAVRTFEEAAVSYLEAGGEARFLPPLIRRFKGRVLGSIRPGELRAAAQAIYPGCAPRTLNRQGITPARSVINHAAALGWCPAMKVEAFEARKPKRRTVDRQWIDAFMATADSRGLHHAAAAMLFMHTTATRIGETVRIMPEHVDLQRRVVVLASTKEEDWEERALTTELIVRIANLKPRARPIGDRWPVPLFGYSSRFTLGQAIERICKAAGIPHVPSHQSGRHSAATHALGAGFSVRQVMDAYGWKTSRVLLETYAHSEGAARAIADHFDPFSAQQASAKQAKKLTRHSK